MENEGSLTLENRKKLTLTGVCGVDGMTDKEVCVRLDSAKLVIKGAGLSVSKLNVDDGNLTVVGEVVNSLVFGDDHKVKAGISKLFK